MSSIPENALGHACRHTCKRVHAHTHAHQATSSTELWLQKGEDPGRCQADKSHQGESRAASLSDPWGIFSELKAAKVRTSSLQVSQATEEGVAKTVSQFDWKLLRVSGTKWTK